MSENCINCGHDARCHSKVYFFRWAVRWQCNKQWGLVVGTDRLMPSCYCVEYAPSDKKAP